MDKIVLASSNRGKCDEIQHLLAPFSFQLILQKQLNIADVEETGLTFVENALLKARNAAEHSGLPALSDDSGLAVDALNGAPGVYSARYAGPGASDADLMAKLLHEMRDVKAPLRTARYHCVMVLMRHPTDPAPIISHGIWEGMILEQRRGEHGFGYDPVFYVPSHHCSAAELKPSEKNRISHRADAMAQLIQQMPQ